MIKAEANVVGTIKRSATVCTDQSGNSYLSIIMTVVLPDVKTGTKSIVIFVSLPNTQQEEAQSYVEGVRVAVSGNMDIRKRNEELCFYVTGNSVETSNVSERDTISGTMTFRGYLKKDNLYEQKTDKNGHPFIVFSAYSIEKVGEEFVSTWVNFMRFPEKGCGIETIVPDWLHSKAHVNITGELQVSAYNGIVRLSCRVKDMSEHVYVQH